MFVVFDLDGTLALNGHRVHHIRGPEKDYDAFYAACVDDQPNDVVLSTLWSYIWDHHVEIWTGRSDQVRGETEAWLAMHVFAEDDERYMSRTTLTRMRRAGDHRPDVELKREWLREVRAAGQRVPDLAYDDRDSVVAMWREEGVPCFQVAPGPF